MIKKIKKEKDKKEKDKDTKERDKDKENSFSDILDNENKNNYSDGFLDKDND
jgi:hypothetical protein